MKNENSNLKRFLKFSRPSNKVLLGLAAILIPGGGIVAGIYLIRRTLKDRKLGKEIAEGMEKLMKELNNHSFYSPPGDPNEKGPVKTEPFQDKGQH